MVVVDATDTREFERAKAVVLEIIRQSTGDEIVGKTKLFKAFYFAHLFYAKENARYLSEWPIVKMPNGPGIDRFRSIVEALESENAITVEPAKVGPYKSVRYKAVARTEPAAALSAEAVEAIRKAVEFVSRKSGAQLSDITHEFSRTWNDANEGDELPIYLDLLSDDDYDKTIASAEKVKQEIEAVWKTEPSH